LLADRDSNMASASPFYDVIVIGAGPAGCAAGRLLASWGHRTLVVARPRDRARGLAESIPPSARKLLATVSALDVVERAAFSPNRGNVVWWGTADGRLEGFGESGSEAGLQVFRPDFDALLLAQAAAAGAEIRLASVRTVRFTEDSLATVECHDTGKAPTLTARFVVDCSGRAGVIARRGLRVYEPGHRMQAFLGIWRGGTWPAVGDDRTMVETYRDGWAWSLPISATMRQVGVVVDGTTTRTMRGPTMADTYLAELAKTDHMRPPTGDATLERAWACDASLYSARTFTGPQFLLAGDAGCTIDPLSSFGVKKALASGWLAAVALHTALVDRRRRDVALDFFAAREREVYARDLVRTREYARRALERHEHEFWASRAARQAVPDADPPAERLLRGCRVHAAHEALRASATVDLRWASHVRFVKRPLVRGREIVLDDAVQVGSGALRFAEGVDLVAMGNLAGRHRQVPEWYDHYCQTEGRVPLPQFLGALSLLVAEGALEGLPTFPSIRF
jgi:FADH2-dependent halogenase/halogenation protein CepH